VELERESELYCRCPRRYAFAIAFGDRFSFAEVPPLRVLIADDQEPVRRRVCSTFASRPDFEVCGEASNGQEAVDKAKELHPDLVILDITMPVMNGLDAARVIRECCPATHIVIFSVHRSKHLLQQAQKIGVQGYVTKGEPPQNLLAAADAVLSNQTFFPSDL